MVRGQHTPPQLKHLLLQNYSIFMPPESIVRISKVMHCDTWERNHVTAILALTKWNDSSKSVFASNLSADDYPAALFESAQGSLP
jgi:hypothetical protein